jgi:carboxypeptidase C (cathepsin A)
VGTSQQAAVDVWDFLQIWFADPRFKQYATRDFGIWAESYGGHYGPTFSVCVTWNGSRLNVDSERPQTFLGTERCDQERDGYWRAH